MSVAVTLCGLQWAHNSISTESTLLNDGIKKTESVVVLVGDLHIHIIERGSSMPLRSLLACLENMASTSKAWYVSKLCGVRENWQQSTTLKAQYGLLIRVGQPKSLSGRRDLLISLPRLERHEYYRSSEACVTRLRRVNIYHNYSNHV